MAGQSDGSIIEISHDTGPGVPFLYRMDMSNEGDVAHDRRPPTPKPPQYDKPNARGHEPGAKRNKNRRMDQRRFVQSSTWQGLVF